MTTLRLLAALTILLLPSPSLPEEEPPRREISLRETVERVLRGNPEVAISRTVREEASLGIPVEEAAFLPRFTGLLSASQALTPSATSLTGSLEVDQRVQELTLGVSTLLRSGADLALSFENQRQEVTSAASVVFFSPEYQTSLTLSASVPLLRNAGREATLAPLRIAKAQAEAGREEWLVSVMDSAAQARGAWLALYSAHREVEVRETALALARALAEQTEARIGAGTAAPVDRFAAEAAVLSRQEELLRARSAERNASDELHRLLGGASPGSWDELLVPTPLPDAPPPPGEDETFETAMRRRPEAASLAARLLEAQTREAAARSAAKPSLTLNASAGLSGLAGTPNPSLVTPGGSPFEGSYRDSLDDMVSGDYYNWFVGLSAEIPWRLTRERAELMRAREAVRRQELSGQSFALRARTEVGTARRDLSTALERLGAARAASKAARAVLEAEEAKLSVGASTTVDVLRLQRDYSETLLSEVRALTDAWLGQTRLYRAVGTILERDGIVVH